jgi:hypothetical protein
VKLPELFYCDDNINLANKNQYILTETNITRLDIIFRLISHFVQQAAMFVVRLLNGAANMFLPVGLKVVLHVGFKVATCSLCELSEKLVHI